MTGKERGALIGLIVYLFILPSLLSWNSQNAEDPGNAQILENGTTIMSEVIIPWWFKPLEWIANLINEAGFFMLIIFVLFLIWIGEIKPR